VVECSVGSCLSVDPRFACRLVGGSGGNLLLRVRCSDCRKRVAVSRQLESLECGAPLFAVGFLFRGFGLGKGAGFENLGQVFVSFAFGVAGHWLRCSWCCLGGNCYTLPSCEPFQFSDYTLSAKKYTVSQANLEEDMSQRPHGQSISPDGAKPLIYRKSRNE
jgi:hypothetical protein